MPKPLTSKQKATLEQNRLLWLGKARLIVARLAAKAYGDESAAARELLLHTPFYDLTSESTEQAGEFGDGRWSEDVDLLALERHLEHTPYGYARYGHKLRHTRLATMPDVLDVLRDLDTEAMT